MSETNHDMNIRVKAQGAEALRSLESLGKGVEGLGHRVKDLLLDWKTLFLGAAGLTGFTAGLEKAVHHAEELGKQAQKLRISVEALDSMKMTFEQSGSSAEELTSGLSRLQMMMRRAANDSKFANEHFHKFGISMDMLKKDNPLSVLEAIADALKTASENGDEAATSSLQAEARLLGFRNVLPVLEKLGGAGLELKSLQNLKNAFTGEEAKKADEFGDSLSKLQSTIRRGFGNIIMPSLDELTKGLEKIADSPWIPKLTKILGEKVRGAFDIAELAISDPSAWGLIGEYIKDELTSAGDQFINLMIKGCEKVADALASDLIDKVPGLGFATRGMKAHATAIGAMPDLLTGKVGPMAYAKTVMDTFEGKKDEDQAPGTQGKSAGQKLAEKLDAMKNKNDAERARKDAEDAAKEAAINADRKAAGVAGTPTREDATAKLSKKLADDLKIIGGVRMPGMAGKGADAVMQQYYYNQSQFKGTKVESKIQEVGQIRSVLKSLPKIESIDQHELANKLDELIKQGKIGAEEKTLTIKLVYPNGQTEMIDANESEHATDPNSSDWE